jgi:histone arginine demethylase JMJD6
LPKILDHEGQKNLNCIKCLQRSGETIFVPGGWWYAVITIEDSMSVTQKFVSHANFHPFWKSLRCTRTKLSEFLLKVLKEKDQYLYDTAIDLNARDNYRMPTAKTANKIKFEEDLTTTTYLETPTGSS